jgi:hypothetical protein
VLLLKRVDEPGVARTGGTVAGAAGRAGDARDHCATSATPTNCSGRIELEAVSIATTALVSLLYLAGGFLQIARVIDIPSARRLLWVFPLVCLVYGLVKIAVGRQYR